MASEVHRLTTPAPRPSSALRVVLVTSQFPTPTEPERGVFTLQIAQRLATRCRLTVVCPLPWFPAVPVLRPFHQWYRFAGVPTTWTHDGLRVLAPKYPLIPKLSERFHGRLVAGRLRRVLRMLARTEGIDVINSHWLYPDAVAVHIATRALPVPHVPTGLGCDVNEFIDDPAKGPQILDMLGDSRHVTVVSESLRAHLLARGIPTSKVTTIPNGVDSSRFQPRDRGAARQHLGLRDDGEYALYVGRFAEEKSVSTLIEAMATVAGVRPRTELLLVGDGPLRRSLAEQARRLRVADRVHFVGPQNHRLIAEWMAAADCICLPSTREGCPNVVLEALACGRPVIASAVGGVPEMVTAETGILVPPRSPTALATALDDALNRTWHADVISRTTAQRSWDGVADAYWQVLQRSAATPAVSPGQP